MLNDCLTACNRTPLSFYDGVFIFSTLNAYRVNITTKVTDI